MGRLTDKLDASNALAAKLAAREEALNAQASVERIRVGKGEWQDAQLIPINALAEFVTGVEVDRGITDDRVGSRARAIESLVAEFLEVVRTKGLPVTDAEVMVEFLGRPFKRSVKIRAWNLTVLDAGARVSVFLLLEDGRVLLNTVPSSWIPNERDVESSLLTVLRDGGVS